MLERLDGIAAESVPIAADNVFDAAEAALAGAPPRFFAVGFSLGGFVVLELLRRAPERLIGAVLIASNANPAHPDGAEKRRAEVALAREAGMTALIETLWPLYVAPDRQEDRALKQTIVAMAEDAGPELFALQAELAIGRPDSRSTVSNATVPVLALRGTRDAMSPPDGLCLFGPPSPARLVELTGVGHFLPLEAPDAAACAITDWMRECTPCC